MRRWLVFALFVLCVPPLAGAHTMMMTQVLVSFGQPDAVDVKIDVDLTLLLGSPERYYEVATESPERQKEDVERIVPRVVENLQLFVGQQRLQPVFRSFSAAKAQKADYLDASMSKLSTLTFVAALPVGTGPLKLVVPIGAEVDYPVAYTVQIPSAHLSVTRWVEEGMHESDPFVWAGKVPKAPASGAPGAAPASPPASAQGPARGADLQPRCSSLAAPAGPVSAARLPPHRPGGRRPYPLRAGPVLSGDHLAQAALPDDRLYGRPRHHALPLHLRHIQPAEPVCGTGDRPLDRVHCDRKRG